MTVHHGERLDLSQGDVRDGKRIVSIRTESGSMFTGATFIDASYEGDLMAEAGVPYVVGREGNAKHGQTLNGFLRTSPADRGRIWNLGADDHVVKDIDPFMEPASPASGLPPPVNRDLLPPGTADHRVQAFNYRLILTDATHNQIPFEKPAGYRDIDRELLLRTFEAGDTRLRSRRGAWVDPYGARLHGPRSRCSHGCCACDRDWLWGAGGAVRDAARVVGSRRSGTTIPARQDVGEEESRNRCDYRWLSTSVQRTRVSVTYCDALPMPIEDQGSAGTVSFYLGTTVHHS